MQRFRPHLLVGLIPCLVGYFLPALAALAQAGAETPAVPPSNQTLTILSVDAATLPGLATARPETLAPSWRTSFGSERRSAPERSKPQGGVDADLVLLQSVRDIKSLRLWFPAREWKLVVSKQLLFSDDPPEPATRDGLAPVPTTAVAVRYRPGLRVTAQDHLMDMAKGGSGSPSAAGTAVRVLIEGRETWALSVLLPDACFGPGSPPCPALDALKAWHLSKEPDGVRRVTGGRYATDQPGPGASGCGRFGLKLDPAPAPPKAQHTAAEMTPTLGCAAAVTVTK